MTQSSAPIRVVAIANVPGPNLNDFFDQVARHSDQIDLKVLYCSRKTGKWREGISASDGHRHVYLRNLNPFSRFGRFQINPGVLRYLIWDRPNFVQIQGYTTPTLFLALTLCSVLRRPFLYWGEAIDRSGSTRWLALAVKRWVVRCLNRARHIFIVGSKGRENYQRLGLKHSRMSTLLYSCDLSPFFAVRRAQEALEGHTREKAIVTTSQLIDRKRVDILVDSFVALADAYPDWALHIIGTGPNQSDLEGRVPQALTAKVTWHKYLPKAEHPDIYARSEIFALPSNEDGGPMALAEALAAGLPVVTTDGVVTSQDLVSGPGAGFVVPRDDLQSFKDKLSVLMSDDDKRTSCGDIARKSAQQSQAEVAAAHFIEKVITVGASTLTTEEKLDG